MGYIKKKINTDLLPEATVKPFGGRPRCPVCGLPTSRSYINKEGVEIGVCPKGHRFILRR